MNGPLIDAAKRILNRSYGVECTEPFAGVDRFRRTTGQSVVQVDLEETRRSDVYRIKLYGFCYDNPERYEEKFQIKTTESTNPKYLAELIDEYLSRVETNLNNLVKQHSQRPKKGAMSLGEAKEILENSGFLVEDFEEDVARKRLRELEGTFDIQGDEAKFFDTDFPFAKIEHGRLMLYRPVSVDSLDGENVKKLSIPYKWIDVTEYDDESWNKACNFVDAFRRGVVNFEIELQINKSALEKSLRAINKYSKI